MLVWLRKTFNFKEMKRTIFLIILIFAFRSIFFEPFRIPSGSMIPTLNIGDLILVNKLAYGLKIPFSDMYTEPVYITEFEPPQRYDVVVFKYPPEPNVNYIKRVIGLPGDEIEIVNKSVYVNGQKNFELIDSSSVAISFKKSFDEVALKFYSSKKDKESFYFQESINETPADTIPKFNVPKGYYFVMGDNRDFSSDSRYWGFVPKENIKGKALVVWWSMTLPLLDEGFSFSPGRIGNSIY